MTIDDVIAKHFPNGAKYFLQSDRHHMIEGDTYLRYERKGELWFGGDNGEFCILHTDNAIVLDKFIEIIINPNILNSLKTKESC